MTVVIDPLCFMGKAQIVYRFLEKVFSRLHRSASPTHDPPAVVIVWSRTSSLCPRLWIVAMSPVIYFSTRQSQDSTLMGSAAPGHLWACGLGKKPVQAYTNPSF